MDDEFDDQLDIWKNRHCDDKRCPIVTHKYRAYSNHKKDHLVDGLCYCNACKQLHKKQKDNGFYDDSEDASNMHVEEPVPSEVFQIPIDENMLVEENLQERKVHFVSWCVESLIM